MLIYIFILLKIKMRTESGFLGVNFYIYVDRTHTNEESRTFFEYFFKKLCFQ